MSKSKLQQLEPTLNSEPLSATAMTKEKRPQDWNLEERLQLVIACGSLGVTPLMPYAVSKAYTLITLNSGKLILPVVNRTKIQLILKRRLRASSKNLKR